jgi:hypothetical protein
MKARVMPGLLISMTLSLERGNPSCDITFTPESTLTDGNGSGEAPRPNGVVEPSSTQVDNLLNVSVRQKTISSAADRIKCFVLRISDSSVLHRSYSLSMKTPLPIR